MRTWIAGALAAALLTSLLTASPASAASVYQPPTAQRDWVTPSHVVAPLESAGSQAKARRGPGAPVWPAAGVAEATVPAGAPPAVAGRDRASGRTGAVPVGGLPVSVASSAGLRAAVRMYDRATTAAAGVKGVL